MRSQDHAPLLEALEQYRLEDPLRLHMPGHKGRSLADISLPGWDVTEVPGLDDLHDASAAIAEAQALCADLYGADYTHFLVGGSTAGNVALCLATAREGEAVLVPRHAHRSLLTGLVLSGARPVWLEPLYDDVADLVLGVPAYRYEQGLKQAGRAAAFWAVSPTYQGVAQDLEPVAALAAASGAPLLVDEAHGAHFPFDPRLPRPALQQGATAVVQSAHKTLEALTQSAWVHVRGSVIDHDRLQAALRLVQSSSPSYVLMASLDAARRAMAGDGPARLAAVIDAVEWLRGRLAESPLRPVLPCRHPDLAWQQDPTKLWLDVTRLGLTGPAADALLRERLGLQVEMAGPRHVLGTFSVADDRGVVEEIARRLTASAAALPQAGVGDAGGAAGSLWLQRNVAVWPEPDLTPREATFRTHEAVPLRNAVGRISAGGLVPYPPGIPLVMPGERLTAETLEFMQAARAAGVRFQGAFDPSLQQILVVA